MTAFDEKKTADHKPLIKVFFTLMKPVAVGERIEIESIWYDYNTQHFSSNEELLGEVFYITEEPQDAPK